MLEGRGAHAGYTGRNAKCHVCQLAAHQIGFVQRRTGDQQVGIRRSCFGQHAHIRAIAHYAAQIEAILQILQTLSVRIDDRDVVALRNQALGHAVAHTACTQNNDLHALSLLLPRTPKRKGSPSCPFFANA